MDNFTEQQITTGLPRTEVNRIVVKENNEPLVEIFVTDKIKLLHAHKFLSPYVRKSVWWHYSYGDQIWAAYTRRTECVYGKI